MAAGVPAGRAGVTYLIIPDGPLAALRPWAQSLVSNLDEAKARLRATLACPDTTTPITDAKRIDYAPIPMMLLKSGTKLVIKNRLAPSQHLTIDMGRSSLETHRTDELKKSLGQQWWQSLGAMELPDIPRNIERAERVVKAMAFQVCQIVPMGDPALFGFFISPHRVGPSRENRLPLHGKRREAKVDLGAMIDRLQVELVDSYAYDSSLLYTGSYLQYCDGAITLSEDGLLTFAPTESGHAPVAFTFTTMRDYLTMTSRVLCRLLGLQEDVQIVPPISDA